MPVNNSEDTVRRFGLGFMWGLVATFAMTAVMVLVQMSGAAPMPEPVPIAVVRTVFGNDTGHTLIFVLAVVAHFAYGALWAALLAVTTRPVTFAKSIGLSVFLWFVMQALVLPLIGWGAFGGKLHPLIWFATLVLHLVYGGTLGLLLDRDARTARPEPRHQQV